MFESIGFEKQYDGQILTECRMLAYCVRHVLYILNMLPS